MINEVYYAVMFFPELENKSIEMLKNAPNFVELDMEWHGIASKLTIEGDKMFLLMPGDTLLFNQKNEFSHVLHSTGSIGIPKKKSLNSNLKGYGKMINKELLISYLEERIKEYEKQIVVLQSELLYSLINNNKREFSIKNLRNEYLMNNIRVYEDLLEKINNGEFRNQKIKK